MACQNDIYSTHKISCNFQNNVQLSKIYHATLKITCNSGRVYILGEHV